MQHINNTENYIYNIRTKTNITIPAVVHDYIGTYLNVTTFLE